MAKRRLKKPIKIALAIIILLIALLTLFISFYGYSLSKVNNNTKTKEIIVNQGDTINSIIDRLEKENLIRSEWAAKIYIKLNGISNLQAGTYDISSSYSTKEIINIISTGNVSTRNEINITFKEGKNIRDYAKVISEKTNNKEIDVFNLLKDNSYIDELIKEYWFLKNDIKNPSLYYPLEGYLFPNTYRFKDKNVTVKEIFKKLLDQTNIVLSKYKDEIEKKNMSIHEFITLASIVELEGKFDEDRATIAGVFYNRLDAGWSLGSDVTTYYANKVDMGKNPVLTAVQIAYNSPYNTRLASMAGKLPIGPISNPGEASIKAAIEPKDSNNWYFVADCRTMTTVFSKTESEHLKNANAIKASGCKF